MSTQNKDYAEDYTLQELLVVSAAREIKDNEVVFVGVAYPASVPWSPNLRMPPTSSWRWRRDASGPHRIDWCSG